MRTTRIIRFVLSTWCPFVYRITPGITIVLLTAIMFAAPAVADALRVMKTGLGSGTITGTGISCGSGGSDCDETYAATASVTLTAAPVAGSGSVFSGWGGDCSGAAMTCTVNMNAVRSVRAEFSLVTAIPTLSACVTTPPPVPAVACTPEDIRNYLIANPEVSSTARFIKALPLEYKQNWLLMSRSESLQTGTADSPRILMPSADAQRVFTVGTTQHSSYPGAHPNAIEYMQWDATQKNFRFHEIVLDAIPEMGDIIPGSSPPARRFPARTRGVSIDDSKCFACHSTRNVLNRGTTPGTDGLNPIGSVRAKNKPNWDTYNSWGGMLAFNRDRVYQGSVEAAAFRKFFNLWTWQTNDPVRSIIEQLELQPPGVPAVHAITRATTGGANDGHINFGFDAGPPILTEPAPSSSGTGIEAPITTSYSFDGLAGTGTATSVVRGGSFVTLHHSGIPTSDEGRGVQLFDLLGGADDQLNPQRIADELINHRVATGNVPIDVRAIALAIAQRCITVAGGSDIAATQTVTSTPALSSLAFFDARHGITSFNQLYDDTRLRAWNLPRRKADIQKIDLDRTIDPYAYDSDISVPPPPPAIVDGLVQLYGATTSAGTSTTLERLRQEVFRRPIVPSGPPMTSTTRVLAAARLMLPISRCRTAYIATIRWKFT